MIRAHKLRDGATMCDVTLDDALAAPPDTAVWLDIEDPCADDLALLARLEFHPLAIEDCAHPQKRSKFERFPTHGFAVFHALDRATPADPLDTAPVSIFIRTRLVVTVHHGRVAALVDVASALGRFPERVGTTAERVVHAIFDGCVDEMTTLLFVYSDRIDELEEVHPPDPRRDSPMRELLAARRDLLLLRRITLPQREVVQRFVDAESQDVSPEARIYFRDVLDHLEFVLDETHLLIDVCNGSIQLHANTQNERLNQVMKYLAIVSTLAMPFTVISGAFGMNFARVPFANAPYGFEAATAVMFAAACGLVVVFRVRRWL